MPLPDPEDILAEAQDAVANVTGSKVQYRDRYGHVMFNEVLRQVLLIRMLEWINSDENENGNHAELMTAFSKLIEAVYRSA